MESRSCEHGGCYFLPVKTCFARPRDWTFSTSGANAGKLLRKHLALHEKHASQRDQLSAVAERTTRLENGFRCRCGREGSIGVMCHHVCSTARGAGGRLLKRARGESPAVSSKPAKRRRRCVQVLAVTSPRAAVPGGAFPEDLTQGPYAELTDQFQRQDAGSVTSFLRAMNVTCMLAPPLPVPSAGLVPDDKPLRVASCILRTKPFYTFALQTNAFLLLVTTCLQLPRSPGWRLLYLAWCAFCVRLRHCSDGGLRPGDAVCPVSHVRSLYLPRPRQVRALLACQARPAENLATSGSPACGSSVATAELRWVVFAIGRAHGRCHCPLGRLRRRALNPGLALGFPKL